MAEEPKKNHWYEMYELECLKTKELEKENARLKDGIALKDEEVGCIETDFNTFKSRAKEIIKNLMKFAEIDCREYEEAYKEAEQFVKE